MTDPSTLPIAEFAFPGPLRDRLVTAILAGSKTSTTSTLIEYSIDNQPLPIVGTREVVVDSAEEPVAIIETVAVDVVRLGDVDMEHVSGEGEGFTSLENWRTAHEDFWHSEELRGAIKNPSFTVNDQTALVLERFKVTAILA